MVSSSLEDHFRTFRTSGDPTDLAQVFDATAPTLLRVASHLCAEGHAAEDIVQSTFLSAIESADRYPNDAPVLAWLLSILANRARYLRRQTRRQPDPHRLIETIDSITDPVSTAQGRELSDAFREAMAQLPDQYAQVLRLHLWHGLTAREIAEVMRRPAGTAALATASPGLAAPAQYTTLSGTTAGTASTDPASLATSSLATNSLKILGGLALMQKALIAGVAVCVTLVGWYIASPPDSTPPLVTNAKEPAPEPRSPTSTADPTVASPEESHAAREELRQVLPSAAKTPVTNDGRIRVHCVLAHDGSPAQFAAVRITARNAKPSSQIPQALHASDEGTATFTDLPAGEYQLTTRGASKAVTVTLSHTTDTSLRLKAHAIVRGRVVDEHNRPVAAASIDVFDRVLPQTVLADREGRFCVHLSSAANVRARKAGKLPSKAQHISTSRDEIVFVLSPGGRTVSGLVIVPDGQPAANARIAVIVTVKRTGKSSLLWPAIEIRTDAKGRFTTSEVANGRRMIYAFAKGHAFGQVEIDVGDAGLTDVLIQLHREAQVHGVLRDTEGKPMANVSMNAHRVQRLPGLRAATNDLLTYRLTKTGADGSYRFANLPTGQTWVAAMVKPRPKHSKIELQAGQEFEWNPDLTPAGTRSIRGVLIGPDGMKLNNWRVATTHLDRVEMQQEYTEAKTDHAGRFELRKLRDLPYTLTVSVGRRGSAIIAERKGVTPGEPEFTWQIPFLPRNYGTIVGSLLDREGKAISKTLSIAAHGLGMSRTARMLKTGAGTGAFRIKQVPPGTWTVLAWCRDYGWHSLGTHTVAAKAETDIGERRLADLGHASIRVTVDGEAAKRLRLSLTEVGDGKNKTSKFNSRDGTYRSAAVPPGRYKLQVRGDDIAPLQETLTITQSTTTTVEVQAKRATTVALKIGLVAAESSTWTATVKITVHCARRGELFTHAHYVANAATQTWRTGLAPGRYTVEAESYRQDHRRGRVEIVVPDTDRQPIAVNIDLALVK